MSDYPLEQIEYRIKGTGNPPILLLHGWGGSYKALDVLGEPLAQHRRIFSVSLPGFGASPEPAEAWNASDYSNVVKNWLDRQGIETVDIIAHSFGGRIAIGLAANYPRSVGRLVLMASAGIKPRRSIRTRLKIRTARGLKRAASILGGRYLQIMDRWRDRLGSQDWKLSSPAMRRILVNILDEDQSETIARITVPTLLIWGNKDTATPLWMGEKMNRLIRGSKLVTVEGAGHFCYLEQKGEVLAEIWKHLQLPSAW